MSETLPASTLIDFSTTDLAKSYTNFYAKILDNVFSPSECAALISLAASEAEWSAAGMMMEAQGQTVHSSFRHSERILRVDSAAARMIYERLRPMVEEIYEIGSGGKWGSITGKPGRGTWKIVGVNPRLSFLRYGPGNFFKPHCDGLVDLLDGTQKSWVTLHIYLNDESTEESGLTGGATRFWTSDKKHHLDVVPKVGRVLVFQQRMLVHSGEEVTQGVKYTLRSDFMFEKIAGSHG